MTFDNTDHIAIAKAAADAAAPISADSNNDNEKLAPNEVLVRAYVLDTLPEDMWPSTRYSIEVAPRCFRCHQGVSQAAKTRIKFLVTFVASIPTHAVKLCLPCSEHILNEDV